MKKAAFLLALALALVASHVTVAQEEPAEETDSFTVPVEALDGGEGDREYGRDCTPREFMIASNHCDYYHAPGMMHCAIKSCRVQGRLIIYKWGGYHF
jgi:hypothetical protein